MIRDVPVPNEVRRTLAERSPPSPSSKPSHYYYVSRGSYVNFRIARVFLFAESVWSLRANERSESACRDKDDIDISLNSRDRDHVGVT